jgi:predicted transglutaminase-like cysteine proteinase
MDTSMLEKLPRPRVRLTGTDGNVYMVLGTMRRALRKAGWTAEQIEAFTAEATSGDYHRVLATCMKYARVS